LRHSFFERKGMGANKEQGREFFCWQRCVLRLLPVAALAEQRAGLATQHISP
jgi:hypothetical protein